MSRSHGIARGLTNYGDQDFARYLRRSFARSMGLSTEMLGKPIVGIAVTPSGFNNCHRAMPELVEAVSRGVLAAGALPRTFPTISLGEVFLNPTSMMFRNLMAMDTEEMIRAQPMDAVVLIGGCDKTVPAQLMGAASANIPAVQLVTGPMSTGRHRGERLGACTDCRRFWGKYRGGEISRDEIDTIEGRLSVTSGTCAVMGTASTMACIAETLGMSLPGTATIPATHSDRLVAAEETGRAAVALINTPITPSQVITHESVENAFRVLMALGGSTNAVIHLTAVAGRLGIRIPLSRLNEISDETPVLVDLKPVGEGYMEDLHAAGGMGAVLRELRPLLNLDTLNVEGRSLAQRLDEPLDWVDRSVVRPLSDPVSRQGGLIALHGNLAPDGAIFKRAAAWRPCECVIIRPQSRALACVSKSSRSPISTSAHGMRSSTGDCVVVMATAISAPMSCSMLATSNSRSGSAPMASLRPPMWKCASSIASASWPRCRRYFAGTGRPEISLRKVMNSSFGNRPQRRSNSRYGTPVLASIASAARFICAPIAIVQDALPMVAISSRPMPPIVVGVNSSGI